MPADQALTIWRSVRTTFFLFLVVVPLVILSNGLGETSAAKPRSNLLAQAATLVAIAGLVAEIGRRIINALAGSSICHWRGMQ